MNKFKILIILLIFTNLAISQRLKDLAYFKGDKSSQVIGYGLVVGLAGTGDSYRSTFTVQSITSMLKRFGITVPQADLRTKNVAAVMVTGILNPHIKVGGFFDVAVSSMGDATSLQGGTLLMTPLSGLDGKVYGFAQGAISIGGFDINTLSGSRIMKNHAAAGRIPGGGILEEPLKSSAQNNNEISIVLKEPDYVTSNNIATTINNRFADAAKALDASEIVVKVPDDRKDNIVAFISELESMTIQKDVIAKVVLNERTGTIIAGQYVRILPCTITHGSLNITIRSFPIISQPAPFSQGTTQVFNNLIPTVTQDSTRAIAIQGASTVQEVAAALNSLKVVPRDIIAIFQSLKEAGALIAELVII